MRLHKIGALLGTAMVLGALSGCGAIRGNNNHYAVTQEPVRHFKTNANTPHAAAQNEIALAQEYIKEGQYEIALSRLQKAVKLDPSSPDGYTMLGLLYEKINRAELAEANYAKAVKLAPDKGDMLNNYGAWLCRSGHPKEADPLFRRALADPFYQTPASALGNAAICALKAGNPVAAEAYDRQILGMDANNQDALRSLALIQFQRGDYLRARGFVERLLATPQITPDMLDLAAQIEDKLGDHDGAQAYRARLTAEFPQFAPSHP